MKEKATIKTTIQEEIQDNPNSERLQNLLDKMDTRILELMKSPSNENLKRALLTLARKKELQDQIEIERSVSG